jgi:hypothetical protein
MVGDEQNKALRERLIAQYKRRGMEAFVFTWEGSRVPDKVIFPDGLEREVSYIRDGILLFRDNASAVYDRFDDIYPKQPQSIMVGFSSIKHSKPASSQ